MSIKLKSAIQSAFKLVLGSVLGVTTLFTGTAGAVTVDAGDYTRLPDGTNLAAVYYQHFGGSDLYAKGNKISDDAKLTADVGILRLVHFMDVGDYTIVPQFLLPFGRIDTEGVLTGAKSTNGIGDLIFAPTVHLLKDPERKSSFAVTPWIYIPTGNYDHNNALNAFGENRWKLDLQAGYITPLNSKLSLDLIGDVVWYGENRDFGSARDTMKQDTSYQFQTHLRYHVSPLTFVAGMISYDWGGETMINGVAQGNQQQRTQALVTAGHFISPSVQLLGSYGQDLSIRTGIKENNRINLRLVKVF